MKYKQKQYDDDDGMVVCNMDVDGMPWHDKRIRQEATARKNAQGEQMTKAESLLYTWYSILAGLLVVAVFSVTWILFTLFCTQIWFR